MSVSLDVYKAVQPLASRCIDMLWAGDQEAGVGVVGGLAEMQWEMACFPALGTCALGAAAAGRLLVLDPGTPS